MASSRQQSSASGWQATDQCPCSALEASGAFLQATSYLSPGLRANGRRAGFPTQVSSSQGVRKTETETPPHVPFAP